MIKVYDIRCASSACMAVLHALRVLHGQHFASFSPTTSNKNGKYRTTQGRLVEPKAFFDGFVTQMTILKIICKPHSCRPNHSAPVMTVVTHLSPPGGFPCILELQTTVFNYACLCPSRSHMYWSSRPRYTVPAPGPLSTSSFQFCPLRTKGQWQA